MRDQQVVLKVIMKLGREPNQSERRKLEGAMRLLKIKDHEW